MKTSRIIVKPNNFEAIVDDYDIYQFEYDYKKIIQPKGEFIKVEDIQGKERSELNAQAVAYKNNKTCLFLFAAQDTSEEKLKKYEEEHTFITNHVKITKSIFCDKERRKDYTYIDDRSLYQVLANSLFNTEFDSYNNMSGKLYYRIKTTNSEFSECKGYLSFIEFRFSTELYLQFNLVTFKKDPRGPFVLDKEGIFRYYNEETDKNLNRYNKHVNEPYHHNSTDFFAIQSESRLRKTRIFAISKFMKDMNDKFGKYFSLEFEEIPDKSFTAKRLPNNYDYTGKLLGKIFGQNKRKINIICWPGVEGASAVKDGLIRLFAAKGFIAKEVETIEDGQFNIVIIHNEKYYKDLIKKNKEDSSVIVQEDPYKEIHRHNIVQTITIEDYKVEDPREEKKPYFDKIINELEVKASVVDGITYHINEPVHKTYKFVIHDAIKDSNNKTIDYNFYRCTLNPSGEMQFDRFKYSDLTMNPEILDEEKEEIIDKYAELLKFEQGDLSGVVRFGEEIEGMLYSDINNKHLIIRTQAHALPDVDTLSQDIPLVDKKKIIDLDKVRKSIKKLMEMKTDKYQLLKLLEEIEPLGESIKFFELNNLGIFKGANAKETNWLREVIDFIREDAGILVANEIRNARYDDRYELSNITDIQTFYQRRPVYNEQHLKAKDIDCLSYIAGRKKDGSEGGLPQSLPVGCIIRDVIWEKECEYEDILKMQVVSFVRNDCYYTVLPFTFKYLREYMQMVKDGSL